MCNKYIYFYVVFRVQTLTGTNRSRALLKQNIKQNVQQIYITSMWFSEYKL